jgi:hypothetical protein
LKGPNCRQAVYVHDTDLGTVGPCYVPTYQQPYFIDKVIQCVADGGPGHAASRISHRQQLRPLALLLPAPPGQMTADMNVLVPGATNHIAVIFGAPWPVLLAFRRVVLVNDPRCKLRSRDLPALLE